MSGPETKKFKVLLLGDGGVGKTTWVKRHRTGGFETKYVPTLGVEVHPINFFTNRGPITLNIWDCAGQEKFGGLRDGYYIAGQAAIFMFDVTSPDTYKNLSKWVEDAGRVCGTEECAEAGQLRPAIPCMIIGNKVDVEDRKVDSCDITYPARLGIPYCDMSVNSYYNYEKPMLDIIRGLLKDDQVMFVKVPVVPQTSLDHEIMKMLERRRNEGGAEYCLHEEPSQPFSQEPTEEDIVAAFGAQGAGQKINSFGMLADLVDGVRSQFDEPPEWMGTVDGLCMFLDSHSKELADAGLSINIKIGGTARKAAGKKKSAHDDEEEDL